jgi:hypothetical protein
MLDKNRIPDRGTSLSVCLVSFCFLNPRSLHITGQHFTENTFAQQCTEVIDPDRFGNASDLAKPLCFLHVFSEERSTAQKTGIFE